MRRWNFAAGPAMLPPDVVAEAARRLRHWHGGGPSLLEVPFTGPEVAELLHDVEDELRTLLAVPPGHRILFVQGGASLQFSAVPLNLMPAGGSADYLVAGYWAERASAEAARYGHVRRIADAGTVDQGAAYLHVTSCETADGTWEPALPDSPVPLVVDATADLLARRLDIGRCGIVYAGAQKNLGVAGLTVLIVCEDLLGRARPGTPAMLDYAVVARNDSKACTPPVPALWLTSLMLRWVRGRGGVAVLEARNRRKAALVYAAIAAAEGFYRGLAAPPRRADVAVCFRLPTPDLDRDFVAAATEQGLLHLKGHPAVGGVRACLFNAMPIEGAAALSDFMRGFAARHA